jgi:hypothetical protein
MRRFNPSSGSANHARLSSNPGQIFGVLYGLLLFAVPPESVMAPIAEIAGSEDKHPAHEFCAFGYADKSSWSTQGKLEQTILQAAPKRTDL